MTTWTVKTYHKKSCEQHEFFVQRNGKGRIISTEGFRWCEYTVETSDGEFPKFEFEEVPGGDGRCDSLNMSCLMGDNIESSELIMLDDGGCWGDIEIEGLDAEEEDQLREYIDEEGLYSLEDEGDWYLDETDVWIWGPIEVTNDETGEVRIIIADADGNVTDYKED